ncbi:FAD-dependent oxidoreductase [Pseudonocardia acaciae]|uniref:FAD-dependent oxidoreductase n=1 Tax=Pseudonocardia acaciae TaxID=551276 RepID=UPI0006867157|nr:FAD-dependent oxidoreductase [Pseudonocardia acaciae]
MARITVLGAGHNGLATALLLAGDGHEVTVLERDRAAPEGGPERLSTGWERPGVSQFHLPHYMLANWRRRMASELPEVLGELEGMGGRRLGTLDGLPAHVTGGFRAGDEELRGVAARRPVVEGAFAAVAARTPGLTVRRGTKVMALVAGPRSSDGVPDVTGVVTQDGEVVESELVVDAMGRRTPIDALVRTVGARPPRLWRERLAFVYYCRHFRTDQAAATPVLRTNHETVSLLAFVADSGTFSLSFVVASNDRPARELRDVDVWERALTLFPAAERLRAASEPISGVQVMSGAEDQRRSFIVDGNPVVTGLVPVGDSYARTNPSLGRGTSIGLAHACLLRDTLREVEPRRSEALAHRFAEATESAIDPIYHVTADYDRHRMAQVQAELIGDTYRPADPSWSVLCMLDSLKAKDADLLRVYLRHVQLDLTAPGLADLPPAARAEVTTPGHVRPGYPPGGPTRAELLAAIGAD